MRVKPLSSAIGIFLLGLGALSLFAPISSAQVSAGGAILGTIADATGSSVPDAEVTVTNVGTQQKRTVNTNSQGFFDVESLLAAKYDVLVKKPGFQTYTAESVTVDPGARVQLNATLTVGSEATQVTVQGDAAVAVETASSESGGVIASKQIENFALNGRNFTTLALLVPGVNSTNGAQEMGGGGLTTSAPISVNGVGVEFTN